MQRRIFAIVFSLLLLSTSKLFAQDPHFAQFYSNPIFLNPAYAGSKLCPRFALNYRDQWPSMPGHFRTYSASYDQHFDKISGGIGVLAFGDRQGNGQISTHSAHFMYSFHLKVSRKFQMRFALQAGYQQKALDWDALIWGDMIDARYGIVYPTNEVRPDNLTSHNFDCAAGFIGYTEYLYFGMAAHHFTMPYESFVTQTNRLPIRWTGHVGAYIDLKRKSKKEHSFGDISISPNVIYQHQRTFHYLNSGFYLNFYPFNVGVWVRNSFVKHDPVDAVVVMFGVEWDIFKVAYSYDITVGKNSALTGGAHEVSVNFQLRCPETKHRVKPLKCPSPN
ncbi:PorP/SprF family type IX secretion system membrane protein [Bacteroidales bacterium OttesenSCG-928-B11]|nr:PorP/SprF family type IX secretion system membrane protein [Bacteroidales bacterium OttesenSCG-928-C03]MDL2313057.1 PorP/SprF family type IX secretion system membrane protein [Bacteroidales bacterium OttesenSCG-928-B11]